MYACDNWKLCKWKDTSCRFFYCSVLIDHCLDNLLHLYATFVHLLTTCDKVSLYRAASEWIRRIHSRWASRINVETKEEKVVLFKHDDVSTFACTCCRLLSNSERTMCHGYTFKVHFLWFMRLPWTGAIEGGRSVRRRKGLNVMLALQNSLYILFKRAVQLVGILSQL